MSAIINMVKRVASEAETVEDMEKLLVSELEAYEIFRLGHRGIIRLYDKPKIKGNYAVIGELNGGDIKLRQTMKNGVLLSEYTSK